MRKREGGERIIERKLNLRKNANSSDLAEDMFHPLDNTDYVWNKEEKEICPNKLGLKFVPTIRRHNKAKKFDDYLQFCCRLRPAEFLYCIKKGNAEIEDQIIRVESQEINLEKPWANPCSSNPQSGQNEALEIFLLELERYVFNLEDSRKVKDNLTGIQRNALRSLSTWNTNPESDRMIRNKDKGSRFVNEWKVNYKGKMPNYPEDVSIFKEKMNLPWK